jgi:hypothetical protein
MVRCRRSHAIDPGSHHFLAGSFRGVGAPHPCLGAVCRTSCGSFFDPWYNRKIFEPDIFNGFIENFQPYLSPCSGTDSYAQSVVQDHFKVALLRTGCKGSGRIKNCRTFILWENNDQRFFAFSSFPISQRCCSLDLCRSIGCGESGRNQKPRIQILEVDRKNPLCGCGSYLLSCIDNRHYFCPVLTTFAQEKESE